MNTKFNITDSNLNITHLSPTMTQFDTTGTICNDFVTIKFPNLPAQTDITVCITLCETLDEVFATVRAISQTVLQTTLYNQ